MDAGALRPPFWPRIPVETCLPSVKPNFARWQLAHAMVLSCDSRLSKNSNRPNSIFSFVKGLSAGITTAVSSRPKGILSLYSVADSAFAAGFSSVAASASVAIQDDSTVTAQMARTPRRLLPNRRQPPKTAFGGWVDGSSSAFSAAGFIAAPFVCIFITVDPLSFAGHQSFLTVICAVLKHPRL